jgi:plasmid maintenance system killer protein
MRIRVSKRYERSVSRIPDRIKMRAAKALIKFADNPTHPGLNFEQLSGWEATYSIRVNRQYRILLVRQTDDAGEIFAVIDIGTHQIYRR